MRYEKAENLMQLALLMQAAQYGISLGDIEERFGVSRRTAQRMRDAVLRLFPQTREVGADDRIRRWHIPGGVLNALVGLSAEELAALDAAARLLRHENMVDHADRLSALSVKLRGLMERQAARRVEPDLEALLEAEGLAMRPGPKPRVSGQVLQGLRHAIKACCRVRIDHRNRVTGETRWRDVAPYGFLFGNRHYLVADAGDDGQADMRLFALCNIAAVEISEHGFVRDPDFSLQDFAERSFGVFQETPVDVVWRFTPEAASDARDFVFHPRQTLEDQEDGSLIVRFRAGGRLEMAWHLYTWGDQVEVLAPADLADMCRNHRVAWPGLP